MPSSYSDITFNVVDLSLFGINDLMMNLSKERGNNGDQGVDQVVHEGAHKYSQEPL